MDLGGHLKNATVAEVSLQGVVPRYVDPAKEIRIWQLKKGEPIGATLETWAEQVNWTVDWTYPRDIISPISKTFTGDFITVSGSVIATLHKNGALIYTHFYTGDNIQRVWKSGAIAESDQ